MLEQPGSAGTHRTARHKSCHMLLWALQVTIIDYLCYILDCHRVHCIDAEWVALLLEGKSRRLVLQSIYNHVIFHCIV